MPTLTTIGNGAIQGSGTTLANADVNKAVGGDSLIIFCLLYTSPSPRDS